MRRSPPTSSGRATRPTVIQPLRLKGSYGSCSGTPAQGEFDHSVLLSLNACLIAPGSPSLHE
jgi:hypothetical protein